MAEQEDGFLGRWSRLKQEQVREPATSDMPAETETVIPPIEPQALETGEVVELTDADMPAIDSLGEDSDFSGFWSEKVSEGLRRQALRKLFQLPEFNIRDGLNEYDEDYSQFEPLGDTVTYQMKQFIERQKAQFQQALEEDEVAGANAVDSATEESAVESSGRSRATDEPDDEDELGCCD